MDKFFLITVTYSQGLVKRWLVPVETLAISFGAVAGRSGKIRGLTFGREIDRAEADRLAEQGAAFFYSPLDSQVGALKEVTHG